MAQDKKQVAQITDMEVDFAQWYTDVCTKAELISYTRTKGMYVLRPYGYAIWENIQREMDARFKATGHTNVSMPMLIPESLLQKEKDHVEGFAPECAWVTHGGSEELEERLCVRPTSETLFCDHWAEIVHSWRDLPMLYNQWCSVLRWEKTSRPFLRHREFLWQEGHTLHATAEEAIEETERMWNIYADICENLLAMPVTKGLKTDKEKFAGAERTYTIECMMHDRKALQNGTSHYFGDGFAKAFGISFADKNNQQTAPFETSWGYTTRTIGGVIMTHGDNNGLVLPPRVAPIQVIVLPIAAHKAGVTEKAQELVDRLTAAGLRVKGDFSENSPGWKFAEYEMKGVPLRLEIGPKDIEQNQCVLVRRDSREKVFVSLDELEAKVPMLLDAIHEAMFAKAKRNLDEHTVVCHSVQEVKDFMENVGGFAKTMWCGDKECELKMKEEAGVSSRCIPLEQEHLGDTCPVCGKRAKHSIYWGVAY
ncbi:Proline--tRNA ligase [uncultured Eubacteriales bacterium]|uniref:Proline--tRNA ligase n=1 Tax=uncultured Eubacteriales bacterium TaxID=172733 RepID=A0A212KHG1_9FIRM|nr:Proline--tRNA ligase [uncultured Eubacteriales bacterium]